mmetsp:Transcript_3204/g.3579  ORF Transcript_3204/g.3579 Transcript_3204/m.3579 type:complete len:85 (-) Transcript_3204:51-305(-)
MYRKSALDRTSTGSQKPINDPQHVTAASDTFQHSWRFASSILSSILFYLRSCPFYCSSDDDLQTSLMTVMTPPNMCVFYILYPV